ncbi:hypothetical protein BDY17DRAFT_295332 [Neohortaea acidophila]|uniref:Uncharacterized protein n=1 Tax=Neohortaea acidophila TaxID=245834 RepID=A0A6A6PX46_9PEZI|nr:uncharacterized protein BDY17DRAFT_295332 [Neohortaea acidophila]KAF2484269.1 hypothetical protein BDY17DRAFT_295332 [Neohortaea acidophila]
MPSRTRPARVSRPTPKVATAAAPTATPTAARAPAPAPATRKRKAKKQASRHAPSKARRRATDASASTAAASQSKDASTATAAVLNQIEAADNDDFQSLHDSDPDAEAVDLTVDPSTFEYDVVWRLVASRSQRELANRRKSCKGDQPVYGIAQEWAALQAGKEYKITRLSATASYEDQPIRKHYKTDIEHLSEYKELVERLMSWQKHGWIDPCITLQWFYEREKSTAAPPSSSPTVSTHCRPTTTTRQEALVPSQIEELEAQGDYSSGLRL